ncbi:hypothetical protein OCU04_004991 [Sclerotinia nivalis]|uniref:Uncharacterized protein n=1 Tax=Sclerotinia nivalis TaxID=352851 RepID=A0A9X0ANH0_9HELO|nr:hypothetical protein OCU04_004991 [Sclerotinia nivalis]
MVQGQENIAFRNPTISAFRCMIKVMYLIPYVIESTKNLQEITELGGFYCCLPAVSISLYSSFYCSPSFIANLYNDREILLGVANKLRHKELFSDCLSLISGRWDPNDQSFTTGIGDKKLAVLAVDMHNRLGGKLAYAHQTILKGLPTGYTAAAW